MILVPTATFQIKVILTPRIVHPVCSSHDLYINSCPLTLQADVASTSSSSCHTALRLYGSPNDYPLPHTWLNHIPSLSLLLHSSPLSHKTFRVSPPPSQTLRCRSSTATLNYDHMPQVGLLAATLNYTIRFRPSVTTSNYTT